MELQFELDGIIVETPKDWQSLSLVWEFDDVTRFFTKTLDLDVTFHSDGFTYLDQQFNLNGFCERINVVVKHKCDGDTDFSIIFNGIIFISDCTFNLQKCTVQCGISDDSYNAKIKNSQKMKFFLNAGFSKDGSAVSVNKTNVMFHSVASGNPLVTPRVCYRVEDAFRYVIDAMTNNEVEFISDFFGTGGLCDGLMVTQGEEIRDPDDTTAPEVSFKDLFSEVNKKTNIAAVIEDIAGVPTVRIEPWEYFFQENEQKDLTDVPDVLRLYDEESLYATVDLGSSDDLEFDETDSGDPDMSFPKVRWVGWRDNSYYTVDECNVDNTLDLENSEYLIDSNSIEYQIFGNDDNDDEVFLISAHLSGATWFTDNSNFISITPARFFYNEKINNDNAAQAWFGGVASSIAKYLGTGDDEFSAEVCVSIPLNNLSTVEVLDDSSLPVLEYQCGIVDINGNYDATSAYTAPADGAYVFRMVYNFQIVWDTPTGGDLFILTEFIGNTGQVLGNRITRLINPTPPVPTTQDITVPHEKTIFLDALDTVTYRLTITPAFASGSVDVLIKSGSSFAVINAITGGGIFQTYDGDQTKIINFEFDYPLTLSEFESMTSTTELTNGIPNYRNFVDIQVGEGWIKRLAYPLVGGRSSFVLRTQTDPIITSSDVQS